MKNLKKVLALVISCALVFGLVASAASLSFPDVTNDAANASLIEALKLDTALNIIVGDDKGNFNPDANITRAEVTKILCAMMNTGALAQAETRFSDVPSSHWASGYIAYGAGSAPGKGLMIDGYDDGTFKPDDPVTYEQVLKLVVCALGYRPVAEDKGGYPSGYTIVAADNNLTKNAPGSGSQPALRKTVAIIVYNALNTPVMEKVKYGNDAEYAPMDGTNGNSYKTLLSSKFKAYKVEGIVTANSRATSSNIAVNHVKYSVNNFLGYAKNITGMDNPTPIPYPMAGTLYCGGTDAEDLLNMSTVAYIQEAAIDGDYDIIAINLKAGRNTQVVINDASQIFDATKDQAYVNSHPGDRFTLVRSGDAKLVYSYWTDRDTDLRMQTVDVDYNATLIFNGRVLGTLNSLAASVLEPYTTSATPSFNVSNRVRPMVGSVVLTDTKPETSGLYDVIEVKSYETAIVESVVPERNRVVFKERSDSLQRPSGYLQFDKEGFADFKSAKFTLNGAPIEIKDIQPLDVLSICADSYDTDGTTFEVIVTRNIVEGLITETNSYDGTYTIGGEKYKIAPNMSTKLSLNMRDEGKFYLDIDGNIAYMDVIAGSNGNYAYLDKLALQSMGDYELRYLDKDGVLQINILAERVKINNVSRKRTENFTKADINSIFANAQGYTAYTDDQATVGVDELTEPVVLSSMFTSYGSYTSATTLTPQILIEAIVGGAGAPVFNAAYMGSLAGSAAANKFVCISTGTGGITGIDLPVHRTNDEKKFAFNNAGVDNEWDAVLGKFKNGSGGKAVSPSAKIFYIPDVNTTADWKVNGIASLNDGAKGYNPYFFKYTSNGFDAVLMFSEGVAMSNMAIFKSSTLSTDTATGDDIANIYFWENGALAAAPLVTDSETDIDGIGGDNIEVTGLRTGDVFSYNVGSNGRISQIFVYFRPEIAAGTTSPAKNATSLNAMVDQRLGQATVKMADWGIIGRDDARNPKHSVYYGLIYKTTVKTNGKGVVLSTADGVGVSGGRDQDLIIPSDTKVTKYSFTKVSDRRLSAATVADISMYAATDAAGDIKMTDANDKDLNYLFVKCDDGDVVEVMLINYAE